MSVSFPMRSLLATTGLLLVAIAPSVAAPKPPSPDSAAPPLVALVDAKPTKSGVAHPAPARADMTKASKPVPAASSPTPSHPTRGILFVASPPLPRKPSGAGFAPAASVPDTAWQAAAVEIVAAGRGRINYEAGVVKAIGLGALAPPTLTKSRSQDILDAREAALNDALRSLGMAAARVRVTADTRVANYLLKSDDIRVRVEALLRSAEVIEEKVLPTSAVYRVVVQTRLTGPNSLLEAITPPAEEARPTPVATPAPEPTPDPNAPGMPAPAGAEYTSLLVDCRGLNITACMSPKLYEEDGTEVYGTMKISADYVIETGIVSFPRSMSEAHRTAGVGSNPLIVRAHYVRDQNRFCPVISDRDAERVRAANADSHFFERTAVLFLLDPVR